MQSRVLFIGPDNKFIKLFELLHTGRDYYPLRVALAFVEMTPAVAWPPGGSTRATSCPTSALRHATVCLSCSTAASKFGWEAVGAKDWGMIPLPRP